MKSSFCIDLQRFMLIPTKFPLTPDYSWWMILWLLYKALIPTFKDLKVGINYVCLE